MAVNGSVSDDKVGRAEDVDEDDDLDVKPRPQSRIAAPPKGGRRYLPIVAIGAILVAVIAVTVILVGSGGSGGSTPKTTTPTRPTLITFRDTADGYTLTYPSTWSSTKPNDPKVHLLLNIGVEGLDTLQVRPVDIAAAQVDTSNVANIKAFTDAVISGTPVIVTFEGAVTYNGMPGYVYVYKLPIDPASGVTLVHAHYFLFTHGVMITLVFQSVREDFARLAPLFEAVAKSVMSIPVGNGSATP